MSDPSQAAAKVRNRFVWFVGADDGSTGYEVVLEQHEPYGKAKRFHTLFRIEPGGDATAIGMMVGYLDMGQHAGSQWRFIEADPRPDAPAHSDLPKHCSVCGVDWPSKVSGLCPSCRAGLPCRADTTDTVAPDPPCPGSLRR